MVIDEYKIDSTIIRIENRDIVEKEYNKEIIEMILNFAIKKISEDSENNFIE